MRNYLALTDWLRFATVLNSSARTRLTLSAMAAVIEAYIFLMWRNGCLETQSHFPFWCWVVALDLGLTFGTFALYSARSWRGKFAAISLLAFHFLLFFFLLFIALLSKTLTFM